MRLAVIVWCAKPHLGKWGLHAMLFDAEDGKIVCQARATRNQVFAVKFFKNVM